MKKIVISLMIILAAGASMFSFLKKAASEDKTENVSKHLKGIDTDKENWKSKDNSYWKKNLDSVTYHVTREAGTERPFTGKYVDWKESGVFTCSNCGQHLFKSEAKFESGTGWPSFWDVVDKSKIELIEDRKFGMVRTEVVCSRCGAHLGHVFNDGPKPTGLRYCINSVSLNFEQDKSGKMSNKKPEKTDK